MLVSVAMLAALLTFVFGLIALLYGPSGDIGASLVFVIGLALVTTIIQWYIAPALIKWTMPMQELDKNEFAWIHTFVEKTCREHGIKKPKLYIVNDATPNAFAFGRTKNNSNVAIHVGLLQRLSKEEVEAVLGHEIGHIANWDVAVITAASMVPRILYFAVLVFFVPRDSRGGVSITGIIASYVAAILVEMLARLVVMSLSRTRELYADQFGARATGKPLVLANALAKISYAFPHVDTNTYKGMRQFYLADPIASAQVSQNISHEGHWVEKAMQSEKQRGALFRFFSTHPPTFERIENLRALEKQL